MKTKDRENSKSSLKSNLGTSSSTSSSSKSKKYLDKNINNSNQNESGNYGADIEIKANLMEDFPNLYYDFYKPDGPHTFIEGINSGKNRFLTSLAVGTASLTAIPTKASTYVYYSNGFFPSGITYATLTLLGLFIFPIAPIVGTGLFISDTCSGTYKSISTLLVKYFIKSKNEIPYYSFETKSWEIYSLQNENEFLGNLSEQILEGKFENLERKTIRGVKSPYNDMYNNNITKNTETEKIDNNTSNKKKKKNDNSDKKVIDTLLYDVLDISPDASEGEIKKAYHKKALKYHPDRNNDEKSKEIFQKMHFSYQFLIDSHNRFLYDTQGNVILGENSVFKEELKLLNKDNDQNKKDTNKNDDIDLDREKISQFYNMFFGSSYIEELVGELAFFSVIKEQLESKKKTDKPPLEGYEIQCLNRLKQYKRENFIANNLLKKIKVYTQHFIDSEIHNSETNLEDKENDLNLLYEKMEVEIEDLINNELGNYIIQVIGNVYIRTASNFLETHGKSKSEFKGSCTCKCQLCSAQSSYTGNSYSKSFLSTTINSTTSSSTSNILNTPFKSKYSFTQEFKNFNMIYKSLNLGFSFYLDEVKSSKIYAKKNLKKNPTSMNNINLMNFLPPKYKKKDSDKIKNKFNKLLEKSTKLMIYFFKEDIERTVQNSIIRLFYDASTTREVQKARARAIYFIGLIYTYKSKRNFSNKSTKEDPYFTINNIKHFTLKNKNRPHCHYCSIWNKCYDFSHDFEYCFTNENNNHNQDANPILTKIVKDISERTGIFNFPEEFNYKDNKDNQSNPNQANPNQANQANQANPNQTNTNQPNSNQNAFNSVYLNMVKQKFEEKLSTASISELKNILRSFGENPDIYLEKSELIKKALEIFDEKTKMI